jgi:hypothetical protein
MSPSTGRSLLKVRVCEDHPDNLILLPSVVTIGMVIDAEELVLT